MLVCAAVCSVCTQSLRRSITLWVTMMLLDYLSTSGKQALHVDLCIQANVSHYGRIEDWMDAAAADKRFFLLLFLLLLCRMNRVILDTNTHQTQFFVWNFYFIFQTIFCQQFAVKWIDNYCYMQRHVDEVVDVLHSFDDILFWNAKSPYFKMWFLPRIPSLTLSVCLSSSHRTWVVALVKQSVVFVVNERCAYSSLVGRWCSVISSCCSHFSLSLFSSCCHPDDLSWLFALQDVD